MPVIERARAALLLVDFQSRLMPAIDGGASVVANARRLLDAAQMFDVPVVFTDDIPTGWAHSAGTAIHRHRHDGAQNDFRRDPHARLYRALPDRRDLVVGGCETHVCVLQTVLGLLRAGRHILLVRDAVGSRRAESKEAAIRRMERDGAEVVTTEMVLFEWLETAEDPRLRKC